MLNHYLAKKSVAKKSVVKKVMAKHAALFVALISVAFFSAGAQATASAVERLLENNRNIEGEFRQITYSEQGKQLQVSEGIFLLASPSQFVWDSVTPFAQRILSDGITLTVWDVDLEQATQKPLAGAVGNSPAALLGRPAAEVLPHYTVTELGAEKFRLAPKGEQDLFQHLTLSFRSGVISAMSILDALGQTTVIEFNNVEGHKGVAKENFVINLPDHVDVIIEGQ